MPVGSWSIRRCSTGPNLARIVRSDGKTAPSSPMGRSAEFKEWLAGYQIVDVESEARVIEIAAMLSAVPGRAARRRSNRSTYGR